MSCGSCPRRFTSSLLPTPARLAELDSALRANILPPELSSVQATIVATPAELNRYNLEMKRVTNELQRLKSERRALLSQFEKCRSVFAPIRRLPGELLTEIFAMCRPEELYELSKTVTPEEEVDRISHSHLRQLAQVCSRWNEIVSDSPKLWSHISFNTSVWSDCCASDDTLIDLLEYALERGRNTPLFIEACVVWTNTSSNYAFELLGEHSHRWHTVCFYSDPRSSAHLIDVEENLNNLQSLHLESNGSWNSVSTFHVAPRLTEFSFVGDSPHDIPHLPWSQIRKLTYIGKNAANPSECLSLLLRATNVDTALFSLDLRQTFSYVPWSSISSDVKSITLGLAASDSVIGRVFDCFSLPALESFALVPAVPRTNLEYSPPVWPIDQFLALARRSSFDSHLTRFQLRADVKNVDLLTCLAVLPRLEELVISDYGSLGMEAVISDVFLRGLSTSSHSSSAGAFDILPALRFLSLTSSLEFTDAVYVELVLSRAAAMRANNLKNLSKSGRPLVVHLYTLPERERELSTQMLNEAFASAIAEGYVLFEAGLAPVSYKTKD
ncbi:hypothetical protein R3P38DRAFT_3253155 [Favolaschia claudopus]|uniref:F-box domain-containing protein n=1 Tax=Favolaschia claudopus TaxID=2862362 RepID=A0AAW0E096_9AGAR